VLAVLCRNLSCTGVLSPNNSSSATTTCSAETHRLRRQTSEAPHSYSDAVSTKMGSMRVSFLNLDRSPERLASFLQINAHLTDVHRVAATDGNTYTREDLQSVKAIEGPMPTYTNGALGCALSHLGQWELASKGSETLTLAEDDAIFHQQFEQLAPKVLATLPADWDIIQWGWNFDSVLAYDLLPGIASCVSAFDQDGLRANLAAYPTLPIKPFAYRLQRSLGTVCQSISPAGAAKLLRHCLPIRPMETFYPLINLMLPNAGIDNMMNGLYPMINAYVCVPPLVITTNDHARSTVQTTTS